jgi:hypothetical protein
MTAVSAPRPGWELLAGQVNQRRYQALHAYLYEGASLQQAAGRAGYIRAALASLVRDLRAGKLTVFARPASPAARAPRGRTPPAPGSSSCAGRAYRFTRSAPGSPVKEPRWAAPASATSCARKASAGCCAVPTPEASTSPATSGRDTRLPAAAVTGFATLPPHTHTTMAGLLLAIPDLAALDLPALAAAAGYPGTEAIPAASYLLSLLALKLTATPRVSHVDDLLTDPARLAGLSILPKKTALTDYSYRLSHDHQQRFLAAPDQKMIASGLATSDEAIFDLDFHAVMAWGHDPALEKHYVPTRSQRSRSVLTFFAQDTGTHNLVYANAGLTKATHNREVIAFCDHWKQVSGTDPKMLIMDQKVTTQAILDERGVKFATPRMRSPSLVKNINVLTSNDFKQITIARPGRHNKPTVAESAAVKLTSYPGTVRQLIVTGLGRDAPTVIITNDNEITTRTLIERYARRMTIEQRLAEIIQAFCADALSSAVDLNVDLDAVLCVLAQALTAAFRLRLPGNYAHATPRHPPAPLPRHPRRDHQQQRRHHRQDQPPRLLTAPPRSRPARRHHRPLVGRTLAPLRIRMT